MALIIPDKKTMPAWGAECFLSRLQRCRIMLAMYGVLTDADNEKAKRRIAAMANKDSKAAKE